MKARKRESKVANEILYLKLEQHTKVSDKSVFLSDIAKLLCVNPHILAKAKALKILNFTDKSDKRVIISVLKIIEQLQEIIPTIVVENVGETDIIIEFVSDNRKKGWKQILKIIAVTAICFFGTGFTIMCFHQDVDVNALFEQLYEMIMGETSDGYTMIEFSYSIGLSVGIVIFFNHIGGRRITKDPTPVEVKMRIYEQDVNRALIETGNREGKSIDVN